MLQLTQKLTTQKLTLRWLKPNSEAVKNLALNCNLNGSLLIHFSTDYVFDGENRGTYTEQSHPNPLNAYGKSKLLGDQFIVKNSENYLIFRLALGL